MKRYFDPTDIYEHQVAWGNAHPECEFESDETTDSHIAEALKRAGFEQMGCVNYEYDDCPDTVPATDIREAVFDGMDQWFAAVTA